MHRLRILCLGLALSPYVASSCFAYDEHQDTDVVVVASSTSTGSGIVKLQTQRATVHARSITFKNGGDRITITARDNDLQVRFGTVVIRTKELRLSKTLQIDNLQIQKLQLKASGSSE